MSKISHFQTIRNSGDALVRRKDQLEILLTQLKTQRQESDTVSNSAYKTDKKRFHYLIKKLELEINDYGFSPEKD